MLNQQPGQPPAPVQPNMSPAQSAGQGAVPTAPVGGTPLNQPVQNPGHGPALHDLPKISGLETGNKPWVMIFSVIAVFIALIGSFMIYFLNINNQAQIKSLDSQMAQIQQQLDTPEIKQAADLAQSLESSLQAYKTAVSQKVDYSRFNDLFAASTPKDTHASGITVDEKGTVGFSVVAPSFLSAGKTYLAYQKASILQGLKLNSINFDNKDGGNSVTISFSAALNSKALTAAPAASPKP